MFRRSLVIAATPLLLFVLAPASGLAQSAADTLKRASDAMGATQLKTLRYATEGTGVQELSTIASAPMPR